MLYFTHFQYRMIATSLLFYFSTLLNATLIDKLVIKLGKHSHANPALIISLTGVYQVFTVPDLQLTVFLQPVGMAVAGKHQLIRYQIISSRKIVPVATFKEWFFWVHDVFFLVSNDDVERVVYVRAIVVAAPSTVVCYIFYTSKQ